MNKKEIVIETARDLFNKYGYKKVSMDEVAIKSNVTKKTIYTYFKDKEELFRYFITEELEFIRKKIEKNESLELSFIDKTSKNIYFILAFRRKSLLFTNIIKEKDTINNNFLKLYDDQILEYLESIINKEIELKNIKKCDAHLTAFILYKVYIAVMFEYDQELNEDEVTLEITSILKDGLLN